MSDLISRQAVIRMLVEKYKFTTNEATEIMSEIPPEARPKGEWIDHDELAGLYICSECYYYAVNKHEFCPSCGADMRGEEE